MKIDDRVTQTEQDILAIQQTMGHCREIHYEREKVIKTELGRLEDHKSLAVDDIVSINKKVDRTAHALNLISKEVSDLIHMKNTINKKLWSILVALIVSFISMAGSYAYKYLILDRKPNIEREVFDRMEKIMEVIEKSSKESILNEAVINRQQ